MRASEKYRVENTRCLLFLLKFEPLFLYETFQLIQKQLITFAYRINYACEHGFGAAYAVVKKAVDDVFGHTSFHFFDQYLAV